MSERMTGERLAEIEMHHDSECLPDEYESCELLQALKAERAEVARLQDMCERQLERMIRAGIADNAYTVEFQFKARAEAAESKLRAVGDRIKGKNIFEMRSTPLGSVHDAIGGELEALLK